MSNDWKWRDEDWANPSQAGDNTPAFLNQPTVTPSWDSETVGGYASGETGAPPAYDTPDAHSWQDPYAPQHSYPGYDGPPAYTPPPPSSFPYAPVPVARTAPWFLILLRAFAPLLISLLVICGVGAGIAFAVFGTVNPQHIINRVTSGGVTAGNGPTSVAVGAHPLVVIDRNAGAVQIVAAQTSGQITIQLTGQTYGRDSNNIPYQKSGNTVTIDLTEYEATNVKLSVPPEADLKISTNGDNISVDGVSGQLSLDSNGGSITATHLTLRGKSVLSTNAGDVTFDGALDPAGTDDFENNDGAIKLTFPANASFHLDASANGSDKISSDFSQITISGDEAHGDVGSPPEAQVTVGTNAGSIHIYKGPGA